jgi:Arylsulfatase A and related enzymes
MPRNLVVVSLDGVSQTLFWQYRRSMPCLWRMSERSAMFRRFYSAATSSLHSFCSFVHGDASELDHNLAYPDARGCLAGRSGNLFAILRKRGYSTLGVQHGSHCPRYAADNYWGAWPDECDPFQFHVDYAGFHGETKAFLTRAKEQAQPFALYFSDRAARPDDASAEKKDAALYHQRFEKGFSLLDGSVETLLETLSGLELLENTIVVFFGPYGMDPMNHRILAGRFNSGDPYADLSWTPMFIYNNDHDICIADQIVSSIDLKPTILHMLFPDETQPEAGNPLSGVDILRHHRTMALTQSLFALERENEGPAKGMARSIAATDGDQRLIITSDGNIAGEGGMELYFDSRDPGNTRDFLDFFTLDPMGYMIAFGREDIVHVHFTQSFKPPLVMSIIASFNRMRQQLFDSIRFKERAALSLLKTDDGVRLFPEVVFKHKRKRR